MQKAPALFLAALAWVFTAKMEADAVEEHVYEDMEIGRFWLNYY